MLSMLLLSFSSFGQAGTTFTTVGSGDWHLPATWGKPATSSPLAGTHYPSTNDNVNIFNGHAVTVRTGEYACKNIRIYAGQGQPKTGGQLIIGDTTNSTAITSIAKLSLADLMFETATGKPKERATLRIARNGNMILSGAITKGKFQGNNNSDYSNNQDIFYRFSSTSTIEYNGTAAQNIFNFYEMAGVNVAETATSYGNLILSGSGTKTPVAGLGVRGNLTVNSGVIFDALALNHTILKSLSNAGTIEAKTSTINIGENFTNNINTITGIFNKGTGLVNYNGGNQSVAGIAYHNLQFSGSGTKMATGNLSVGSNLDIISGVTFNAGSGVHSIAANLTNAGRIDAFTSTIHIGGTFNSTGQFNKGIGNVIYDGNAQSISPLSYYNLTLTHASGTSDITKTAGGAISVSNIFTINTGVSFAHNNSFFFYDGDANQNITPAVYYNLTLGGKDTKFATTGLEIKNNFQVYSQVNFESDGNYTHTITGNVQNDGTINNPNTNVTNQLNVRGNFTNNGIFNAKAATHTISGNWLNDRTFNSDASTIILNGLNKTITSTITSTGAFHNLTVSNGTTSSMTTDLTVNNELKVENTVLTTGDRTLFLGATANMLSLETATAHVRGNLQTTRNVAAGGTELFGRMGMRITDSSTPINNVTVKRVTGTTFENSSVQRQYYVSTPNAQATDKFTAGMELAFPDFNLTESAGTLYEVYRKNINNTYEFLPKVETAEAFYNYQLADADRKYGVYTLANRNNPLPVELTWFKAQRQAQGVLLTWETASEQDNSGFEVQVSTNGTTFSKVAFVDSKVVNSSVKQRYSYTDNATLAFGTRYYRLAQMDLDGTTTYSSIKAVNMDTKMEAAAAFPNPFADGQEVMVRLPQGGESRPVSLVLTNTLGQVILEQQAQVQDGQVELAVNTAKANAKGMYLLNVIDNGSKYTFKLVKK